MSKLVRLICTSCKSALLQKGSFLQCDNCRRIYPLINGIPCFIPIDSFKEEENQYKKGAAADQKIRKLNFYLRRKIAEVLIEKGFGKNDTGLDIGVGTGANENFEHIYSKVTHDIYAVDAAFGALKKFKLNFPDNFCLLADGSTLPFEDFTFDFVTASGLVHHFIGQRNVLSALFAEIYRVLKYDGYFVFNEPNLLYPASLLMHPLNRVLQKVKPGARGRVPYERPISLSDVSPCLRSVGFRDIDFEATSFVHRYMPLQLIEGISSIENFF